MREDDKEGMVRVRTRSNDSIKGFMMGYWLTRSAMYLYVVTKRSITLSNNG